MDELIFIQPITIADYNFVSELLIKSWSSCEIAYHGIVYKADKLPGFIALVKGKPMGLLTYKITRNLLQIVTLDSLKENIGVGTKLTEHALKKAKAKGLKGVVVLTTNDNLNGLRFYQKRGFKITKIRLGAVEKSRKIKPQIPLTGNFGIPVKDEIELEYKLD